MAWRWCQVCGFCNFLKYKFTKMGKNLAQVPGRESCKKIWRKNSSNKN
uniref:Uncharacterized protein n=1 Tax=Ciona intestinalis TaxID=7719 RepID=H2XX18_CIOIN